MKRLLHLGSCMLAISACSPATSGHSRPVTSNAARHVTFLHIADTHAQLETHPEYIPGDAQLEAMGGFARLKTAIDRERASAPGAVFSVDGGDTFQGSGPAAWSRGEAVLAPFNGLGIDVCVPGNWEVVYGPDRFRDLMHRVTCHVTTYNFEDTRTGERLFAPEVTLERGGVRVMFVGITDPTTTKRQPPDEVVGIDSTKLDGLKAFIRESRAREHADLVVAVTHTGLSISRQLAREVPGLDIVLSGHTHERTQREIMEGNVIVVEPGSLGSFLGRLDVDVGEHGGVVGHRFRLLPIRAQELAEDPHEHALVEASLAPYRRRANEVVGTTKTTLMRDDVLESTMDDFVTDAVREVTGADIGFSNGFRYGPPIPPGPITEGDLWNILPLDARIKQGWVTGKQLRDYLEDELELVFSANPWKLSGGWGPRASGLQMTFESKAPKGARLRSVTINGTPLNDETHYSIAGCEREGEPLDMICRLRGAHDPKVFGMSVHEALRAYLRAHPVIAPAREGRAKATDRPSVIFSQDEMLLGGH
ncbi:MAG TPA: bifunctional metallophosphatase/5'-nucleotidase [Kofleriaceae bacterium]|nr:bifunctional metallophosphatase/5'-nucleotidase [Kofleriaceae bacterium]